MSKKYILFIAISCFISAMSWHQNANADNPKFIFPLSCHNGQDCWAVNFVDVDTDDDNAEDFKCGPKTYDGHKGTDFALPSMREMKQGVDVLAAAAGTVLRFRDNETDFLKTKEELETIRDNKKECGNGVLIDHGNGLNTIYCHLKKGSVVVERNQKVKAGQKIAQVGQSGLAEFPHLHFGVLWNGGIADPYTGAMNGDGCDQIKERMWHIGLPMDYEPVVIFDGGFRTKSPDFDAIKRGEENPKTININSAAFVLWAGFFNVEQNDIVTLRITDPDSKVFNERTEKVPRTRAQQFYFTGRKIGRVQLKKGTYTGYVKIERQKDTSATREKTFIVTIE